MKKSLTLVAAGALALTGCDFAGGTESTSVPVASIEVAALPATNGTEAWDADGSGPDVYLEITNAAGRAIYRSEIQENASTDAISFSVDSAVEIPFATMAMYVKVYETDGDPSFALKMAESQSFKLDQLTAGDVTLSAQNNQGTQIRVVSAASAEAAQ